MNLKQKTESKRKWKHFYKCWYFWVFFGLSLIFGYVGNDTELLYFAEYVGIFIGNIINAFMFYTIFYFIGKGIRAMKRKAQKR